MIRAHDQLRASLRKLALRKKRAAFAVVSVALGIVVVVTVNSLIEGVRDVAIKTLWSEEIDPDVIKVYSLGNPYEYERPDESRDQPAKRAQFLTEESFAGFRDWPEVVAADRPVEVRPVSLDCFTNQPRPVAALVGVPVPVIERFVEDRDRLAGCSNAIPLVVGDRLVRMRFDASRGKWEIEAEEAVARWLGREVAVRLGDPEAGLTPYRYDFEKDQWIARTEEEWEAQRAALRRRLESKYDRGIHATTLSLRGKIVGLRPGSQVMIPLDPALLCERWITQRDQLAALEPADESGRIHYDRSGRRTPRSGEFTEGLVLVRQRDEVEPVAKRIEALGFTVATRERTFENQVKAFDSSIRVAKKVAFAFGGVLLALAGALVWSTTSKTVADSRTEIGLFRALGATRRDVRRLFLGESLLLGLLGTAAGILLGWALALGISHWVIAFARREVMSAEDSLLIPDSIFAIDVTSCIGLLAGTVVLSLLAGWWPSQRAANLDPVRALKPE